MSNLSELQQQLAALSPAEKVQVLQWVARDVAGAFPHAGIIACTYDPDFLAKRSESMPPSPGTQVSTANSFESTVRRASCRPPLPCPSSF